MPIFIHLFFLSLSLNSSLFRFIRAQFFFSHFFLSFFLTVWIWVFFFFYIFNVFAINIKNYMDIIGRCVCFFLSYYILYIPFHSLFIVFSLLLFLKRRYMCIINVFIIDWECCNIQEFWFDCYSVDDNDVVIDVAPRTATLYKLGCIVTTKNTEIFLVINVGVAIKIEKMEFCSIISLKGRSNRSIRLNQNFQWQQTLEKIESIFNEMHQNMHCTQY